MPLQPAGQASASPTRQALAEAVNPNGPGRSGLVIPIAARTNRTGPAIKVGTLTDMMAITPDGKTAYVASMAAGTVTPVEVDTNTAGPPVKVGANPSAMVIVP